jgi:predicted PurR-regulated permease PerM
MAGRKIDDEIDGTPSFLSPRQVRDVVLLAATGLAFYLCWLLVRPFMGAITWALALAVMAHPLHAWLERRIARPSLAAIISVVVVTVVLLAPGVFIIQKLYDETKTAVEEMRPADGSGTWQNMLKEHPRLAEAAAWVTPRVDLDSAGKRLSAWLAARAPAFFTKSVWALTQLVITLLTLFYFFRDRKKLLAGLARLAPLSASESSALFRRVSQTIYASLYGSIAVKVLQGFLGGLMFWILGLPAPALAGAAMALSALLPMFGTGLIWGPVALVLVLEGSWIKALVLAVWGGVVVGQIDNFLYPMLVAGELKLHPLSVFFAVLGGLIAFGASGLVLGPVILAVTLALLEIWRMRPVAGNP